MQQQKKMRLGNLPCLLSILLSLSPIQRNIVLAADQSAITATTIARGILQRGNRCIVSEPITGDAKDGNDDCRHRVFGESGECNQLCLRPVSAQSDFYLRTLRHRRFDWQRKDACDNNEGNSKNNIDTYFCWESVRDTESAPSTPEHDTAFTVDVTTFHFPSSVVRLDKKQANDNAVEPRLSLATKIDLLFATTKVQNNEISLPRSIAEIFQQETTTAARNEEDSGTTAPGEKEEEAEEEEAEEESAAAEDLPGNTPEKSLAADQGVVDLTGRWRPSETISAQDLADYDEFLKACCSDTISYWTRKLVVSSSIVSRQEFIVKQVDEGRIVEFVDIHPLSSNVWNRTIVMSSDGSEGDSQSDSSYRPYLNRLNGPRGDPVLIEAYWQKNGTVFTSFLRNDNTDGDSNANKGLVQTRRYLRSEEEEDNAETNRVMVVETIYYRTSFRRDTDSRKSYDIETPDEQGDNAAATRMVWNWEEVIE